jgi:hypothetical protein
MVSHKIFYSAEEAAEKLSTGSIRLNFQDVYRLAEGRRLPVCFHLRGYVGLFDSPTSSGPFSLTKKPTYWCGYLRGNGVQRGIPRGRTGITINLLYPVNLNMAMPADGYEAIAVPEGKELHPADENGMRLHILVKSCDWLFLVDDLEVLIADTALDAAVNTKLDEAGPSPLTTADIAFCFAGLRGNTEEEWKILIGKGRGWIEKCLVQPGTRGRGGARKLWNPVFIGAALVHNGHAKPNNVRAKFQTINLLKPWLESWKTYEADNFATQ